jgi:succinate dehydrogenase / fumarate reductase, membrane anchor subunit
MVVKKTMHGFSDWAWQRITALVMVAYSLLFVVRFIAFPPSAGYLGWKVWWNFAYFKVFSLLFFLALTYHAWLGVKEITMDYIHNEDLRKTLQGIFALFLVGDVLMAIYILWSLS